METTRAKRQPVAGVDYDPDRPMCQDDYEYLTSTGQYEGAGWAEAEFVQDDAPTCERCGVALSEFESLGTVCRECVCKPRAGRYQDVTIGALYRRVCRDQQHWDLSGGEGAEPIACAILDLEEKLAALKELRGHEHRWNDTDYCDICGADGRA